MTGIFGGDAIYFWTYRKSAKVVHIKRHSRVSVAALPPQDQTNPRILVVDGTVEILEGPTALAAASTLQASEASPPVGAVPDGVQAAAHQALADGKRCLLRVTIDRAELAPHHHDEDGP